MHLQGREGRTALLVAAHQGHDRLLEWLIRARADLADGAGDGPLHYAALGDRPRAALTLANPGAEVNAPNLERRTVLHLAVVNRRQELVKALLEVEADGSLLDVTGDSALHLALHCRLQQGDTAVLDLQLEGGAHCLLALLARDLATANVVSRDGDSALHLAEGLPV